MGECLPYLTHGARWIMIAALAGTKTQIDLKNIYVRNVRIIGSTLRSRTPQMKAQILSELVKNVFPKIESGEMDIDSLAENLKEAKQLVAFCKGKLQHVEDEVNKIMEGKE